MMSRILSVLRSARNSAQLVLEHFGGDLLKDIASNKIDLAQAGRTMELAVLAATRGRHAMNMLEESPWWIQYQLAGLGVTADDILWQRHASNTWLSGSQTYKQWASNLAAGYPIVGYSSPQHARAGSGAAFFRAQHCLAESDGGSLCDAPFIGAAMVGAVTDPLSPKARGGICNLAYRMVASNGEVNSLYEMSLSFTRDPLEPTGYLGRIGEDLVASIIFLNGFLALAGLPQIVLPQTYGVKSKQLVAVQGGFIVKPTLFQLELRPEELAIFHETGSLVIHRDGHISRLSELNFTGKSYFGTSARPAQFTHELICREWAVRKNGASEVVVELTMNNADPSKPEVGLNELLARAAQFAGIATVILRKQGGLFIERAREYRLEQTKKGLHQEIVFIVGGDTMQRIVDPKYCDPFGGVEAVLREFRRLGVVFRVMPRDEANGKVLDAKNLSLITSNTIRSTVPATATALYDEVAQPFDVAPHMFSSSAVRSSALRRAQKQAN